MTNLLDVRNLIVKFYTEDGIVHAVNDISYTLDDGETLGIVGESGCGKSVSVLSIMRLIPEPPGRIESGEIIFAKKDLLKLKNKEMRQVRGGEIAMIFQDPMISLNPVLTIGSQITEALKHHLDMEDTQSKLRAKELLEQVGIPNAAERLEDYPHQFSGGMRQRVMIAMAISCNPKLLIADEPTTALDVTIQAQIIDLMKHLQDQLGMSIIWITHDLGVVARLTKRVIVMYAGCIFEEASVKELYANPRHPYTIGLLRSLPRLDKPCMEKLDTIGGQPPDLMNLPNGCAFAERCKFVTDKCRYELPPLELVSDSHEVACWEKDSMERI